MTPGPLALSQVELRGLETLTPCLQIAILICATASDLGCGPLLSVRETPQRTVQTPVMSRTVPDL